MSANYPIKGASFFGIADASSLGQAEEIQTVRIVEKVIRSFSLCPIDIGVVPLPPLSVLGGAKVTDVCHQPVLKRQAATSNHSVASDTPRVQGFTAPIKILCAARRDLQCLSTRTLQPVR
jgi:hypothetical protein